jgi:hypothetical protein
MHNSARHGARRIAFTGDAAGGFPLPGQGGRADMKFLSMRMIG